MFDNSKPEELNHAENLINEGKTKEALKKISEAQRNSLATPREDIDKVLEVLLKCKELYEKIGRKNYIAYNYFQLGGLYLYRKNDFNTGLEYGMKCLELWEEIENQEGIATGLSLVGQAYNLKGKLDLAIEYCKQSLSIKEIHPRIKVTSLYHLGTIYFLKGELQQSLEFCEKSLHLAEEIHYNSHIALNLSQIGITYWNMGKNQSAIKTFERCLTLSEKIDLIVTIGISLFELIFMNDTIGSRNQAKDYLTRLKSLLDQRKEDRFLSHTYMVSRALILKSSGRSRDRAEAESLLKQVVEEKITNTAIYLAALIQLLILLIEELRISNNLEVLDEIKPLVTRFHNITEKTNSYMFLALGKLYEAKLALIQLNFNMAKRLLTEAQRVAEFHGISPIAQMISSEHDLFLRQQNMWEDVKKVDAPISERMNLAAFDGIIERMRGMHTIEPQELEDESPILLLIISEGGVLTFSYPFTTEWRRDDELFSSFLSAFTSFSGEYFSEELDRAKFGEYTVLLDSVQNFSICYLYKGQTYPARQKFAKFLENVQNNSSILQDLDKFSKTSQVLETKDNPFLENLINEIFIKSL